MVHLACLARCLVPIFAAAVLGNTWAQAPSSALTEPEQQWIAAVQPVLGWARKQGLAVDIIVQPTVRPEVSPLSMAYLGGRCKLVLTMRGNPMVLQQLEDVPLALHAIVIEAMAAHEIGHCWRHSQGAWRALPSGFASVPVRGQEVSQKQRLEEGFADLVGMAWTQQQHPAQYEFVHDWLTRERADAQGGGAHDTSAWVRTAASPSIFNTGASLFEQALVPWEAGVRAGN
jgi:hypothetical protein